MYDPEGEGFMTDSDGNVKWQSFVSTMIGFAGLVLTVGGAV